MYGLFSGISVVAAWKWLTGFQRPPKSLAGGVPQPASRSAGSRVPNIWFGKTLFTWCSQMKTAELPRMVASSALWRGRDESRQGPMAADQKKRKKRMGRRDGMPCGRHARVRAAGPPQSFDAMAAYAFDPRAARVSDSIQTPLSSPSSSGPLVQNRGSLVQALTSMERVTITAPAAWRDKPDAPVCDVIRMTSSA